MITPARVLPYLLILILLCLVGWQIYNAGIEKEHRRNENLHWQVMLEQKRAEISNRDSLILALTSKVERDSLKNSRVLAGLKQANTSLARKIANLRPLLPPETFENDTLASFVSLQDSLIESQALTIRDQEIFCAAQVRDLRQIIALTNEQYEAQKEITASVTEQLAQSTKETRKERRGKRLRNWIIAGLVVWGIAESVK